MKKLIIIFSLIFLSLPAFATFESEVMQQLWDVPTKEVRSEIIKSYKRGPIQVNEIYYFSRSYKRQPVKIFGYYSYPVNHKGKLPAILLSHGGGGSASLPRCLAWSKLGYAVLAIDLPGKGENRGRSRSTGPDMIVKNLLKTQPDPSYNYLIHAVAAARNGITFLATRKEVDPDRIGMIGLSWGGVLTLLTNGQDNRLKAAVNVFGAGHIPEGCTWDDWFKSMPAVDKNIWQNNLDPKNFLATQHAPIYFVSGTNDHCYYLTTFQKSYQEVTADKNYYLVPNLRHKFLDSLSVPALAWLKSKLKTGGSFPGITVMPITQEADNIVVNARSNGNKVTLYYSVGGPSGLTTNRWKSLQPKRTGLYYSFTIPTKLIKPEVMYYVSANNKDGAATSSQVQTIFSVKLKDGTKTYAQSSPIKKLYQHEPPFTFVNGYVSSTIRFLFAKQEQVYKAYNYDSIAN
ncbi:MAG: alpha/beta fold hydrolase [bacterium]